MWAHREPELFHLFSVEDSEVYHCRHKMDEVYLPFQKFSASFKIPYKVEKIK